MSLNRAVIVVLLMGSGLSWDWDAHEYAAREICSHLNCGSCLPDMVNGSIAPDRDFKDYINHHCYDPLWECPQGGWTCPDVFDCPALAKSSEWLGKSRGAMGCEKYYAIGVASHYYLDSRVFWHRVSNEDESACHARFEDKVGSLIAGDFNAGVCSVNVTKADFNGYVSGFEQEIGSGNDYALAAVVIFVLVLVIAIKFRK